MKTQRLLAATILLALPAASALADLPGPENLPASTRWVWQVDVKALLASKTAAGVKDAVLDEDSPVGDDRKAAFRKAWGYMAPIDSITLFGPSADESEAVMLVKSAYTRGEVLRLLGGQADAAPDVAHNGHDLYAIHPEGGPKGYACFYDKRTIVAGHEAGRLKAVLDVLDGGADALPADSPLAGMMRPGKGAMVVMAADGLDKLLARRPAADAQSQGLSAMLSQAESARIELGEREGDLFATVGLTMREAKAADQLEKLGSGLIALMALQSDVDERAAKMLQAIHLDRDGRTVTAGMAWPVEDVLDKLADVLRMAEEHPEDLPIHIKIHGSSDPESD